MPNIALVGNPNVGKSTVFNALTGLRQHTGNWPGKTVDIAQGIHICNGVEYNIIDLPGTYSLMPHSAEEEVARDYICFGGADAVIVVCDAVCLERNLNLVLQTLELTSHVVVCINLMDEAKKKNIHINIDKLSDLLGVPVIGICARDNKGIDELMELVCEICQTSHTAFSITYLKPIEDAISLVCDSLSGVIGNVPHLRWISLQLLMNETSTLKVLSDIYDTNLAQNPDIYGTTQTALKNLSEKYPTHEKLKDTIVANIVITSESIANECVSTKNTKNSERERKIDRFLTSRITGIPIMIFLLCIVFWITIVGANYPSQLLSTALFWVQDRLTDLFTYFHAPAWLHGALVLGVYRVLAWVVAVMLPPMAIFFPLFTLLEDVGYLPRIAFNLDNYFKKCKACGKQCLTMCLGLGCNAVGVTGARIIDSTRERLLAIVTNSFMPCNGRFPPPQQEQQKQLTHIQYL